MTSGNLFRGICAFLLIGVVATVALPGAAITPGAYNQVLNSGTALLRRTVLNMTGAGVTCVDNSGATPPRTDCTVSGGGGGGGSTSSGPYASLPAAGNNGNLYFSTNSPYTLRDNGATWDAFYLGSTVVHLPNALSWAAVDPSGATPTASTATGALVISSTTQNTGNNYWAGAYTAVTPPYTADFGPFAISNVALAEYQSVTAPPEISS
jgi:hypothetical protein